MNCYFLSFGTKKELERIKKRLQRAKIKYTANKEHLFIVFYAHTIPDLEITTNKLQIGDDSYNFEITKTVLHPEHPKKNIEIIRDPRERSIFVSLEETIPGTL